MSTTTMQSSSTASRPEVTPGCVKQLASQFDKPAASLQESRSTDVLMRRLSEIQTTLEEIKPEQNTEKNEQKRVSQAFAQLDNMVESLEQMELHLKPNHISSTHTPATPVQVPKRADVRDMPYARASSVANIKQSFYDQRDRRQQEQQAMQQERRDQYHAQDQHAPAPLVRSQSERLPTDIRHASSQSNRGSSRLERSQSSSHVSHSRDSSRRASSYQSNSRRGSMRDVHQSHSDSRRNSVRDRDDHHSHSDSRRNSLRTASTHQSDKHSSDNREEHHDKPQADKEFGVALQIRSNEDGRKEVDAKLHIAGKRDHEEHARPRSNSTASHQEESEDGGEKREKLKALMQTAVGAVAQNTDKGPVGMVGAAIHAVGENLTHGTAFDEQTMQENGGVAGMIKQKIGEKIYEKGEALKNNRPGQVVRTVEDSIKFHLAQAYNYHIEGLIQEELSYHPVLRRADAKAARRAAEEYFAQEKVCLSRARAQQQLLREVEQGHVRTHHAENIHRASSHAYSRHTLSQSDACNAQLHHAHTYHMPVVESHHVSHQNVAGLASFPKQAPPQENRRAFAAE